MTTRIPQPRARWLLHAGVLLAALAASPAWAAPITVNSLADANPPVRGDGLCTLREAMINADTDGASSDCAAGSGADTITFTGPAASGTITLGSRLPTITSLDGLTIDGARAVTISGASGSGAGMHVSEGSLTLKGLTLADLRDGPTVALQAFRSTLTIVDTAVLRGRSAGGLGGGLFARNSNVTVLRSIFSGNSAGFLGGAIYAIGTRLTISHSTFVGNTTEGAGGAVVADEGTLLTLSNSTFFLNRAEQGGAVAVQDATTEITNTTFLHNTAVFSGATMFFESGTTTLRNTLLAGASSIGHCSGPILDGGGNLEDGVSCGFSQATSMSNTPAGLDPAGLKDNGGSTPTIALCSGADKPAGCTAVSAAVDAGVAATCAAEPVSDLDQRGKARPADGDGNGSKVCDIGAFEVQPAALPFSGFFEPVDNLPTLNTVKAGAGVPVKFSLGGDRGLAILAAGYPQSQPVPCDGGAPQDPLEQTVAAGGSSLGYDASTDTYTYVWKTEKFWAGQCRQLVVRLIDGTDHSALFKLK